MPTPGGSPLPRAKTTSTSGQSADAFGMDPSSSAGVLTTPAMPAATMRWRASLLTSITTPTIPLRAEAPFCVRCQYGYGSPKDAVHLLLEGVLHLFAGVFQAGLGLIQLAFGP